MASNRAFPEIDAIMSIMHPGYDTLSPVIEELTKQQSELSDYSGAALLREATEGLRSAYDDVLKMKNKSEGQAVLMSVQTAVDKAKQASHDIRKALSEQDANTPVAKKLNSINMHLSSVCTSVLFSFQNKLFMMKMEGKK